MRKWWGWRENIVSIVILGGNQLKIRVSSMDWGLRLNGSVNLVVMSFTFICCVLCEICVKCSALWICLGQKNVKWSWPFFIAICLNFVNWCVCGMVCWDVCDMVCMWCPPFVLTKFKCMWTWCFMMDGVRSMLMCIFPNCRVVSMLMMVWSLMRMLQKRALQYQVGPSIGDFYLISFYYFLFIIIFCKVWTNVNRKNNFSF